MKSRWISFGVWMAGITTILVSVSVWLTYQLVPNTVVDFEQDTVVISKIYLPLVWDVYTVHPKRGEKILVHNFFPPFIRSKEIIYYDKCECVRSVTYFRINTLPQRGGEKYIGNMGDYPHRYYWTRTYHSDVWGGYIEVFGKLVYIEKDFGSYSWYDAEDFNGTEAARKELKRASVIMKNIHQYFLRRMSEIGYAPPSYDPQYVKEFHDRERMEESRGYFP